MIENLHRAPNNSATQLPRAIRVVHFQRRPTPRNFSVERMFRTIRENFPPDIDCRLVVSKYLSTGIFRRLYNLAQAAVNQGEVNHVTGDVHFLAFLLRKRRTVITVLDCSSMERLHGLRRILFRWLWLSLPLRCCAVAVAISEFSKRELLRYVTVPPEKVRVIGVPVGPEFSAAPAKFRKQRPSILHIGTNPNKNLERVALALAGVSCRLVIVGQLNDAQRAVLLQTAIEYENRIRVTDTELVELYVNSDLVLFASTYEGFGMPIIEANAIGRPVITSNLCSMPEVAADAACLVDPFDPDSIRQAVLRIVEDDAYREELIQNGLRNTSRFAAGAIAKQYADLYLELMSRRGAE